jgi:hypothetical protein
MAQGGFVPKEVAAKFGASEGGWGNTAPAAKPSSIGVTELPTSDMIAFDKITGGNPVPLCDATQLYQPILGTSAGSKYFLIAIADNLKMAARVKGHSLSIRCEGDVHGKWKKALEDNGFTLAEKHASMHLDAPDMILVKRTIGAVFVGMGLQVTTQLPQIEVIANKGA